MKKILLNISLITAYVICHAQQSEINFVHQNINFSAAPRTSLNPMSIKMWDNYYNGGPTAIGTVLEFYGLTGHSTGQLYFGGYDNSRMRYREASYGQNVWSSWATLLDSKNDLESSGRLMLTGNGSHFINQGNLGLGTITPNYLLHLKESQPTINFEKAGVLNWTIGNLSGNDFYIKADNGAQNPFVIASGTGNVGIGTTTPNEKLAVNGKIRAKEIKVEIANWPDYVFEDDYKPKTILEIEDFIKANKHLPGVPSAKDVEVNGVELGEMNKILLRKIEELMLYIIDLKKENQQIKKKLNIK